MSCAVLPRPMSSARQAPSPSAAEERQPADAPLLVGPQLADEAGRRGDRRRPWRAARRRAARRATRTPRHRSPRRWLGPLRDRGHAPSPTLERTRSPTVVSPARPTRSTTRPSDAASTCTHSPRTWTSCCFASAARCSVRRSALVRRRSPTRGLPRERDEAVEVETGLGDDALRTRSALGPNPQRHPPAPCPPRRQQDVDADLLQWLDPLVDEAEQLIHRQRDPDRRGTVEDRCHLGRHGRQAGQRPQGVLDRPGGERHATGPQLAHGHDEARFRRILEEQLEPPPVGGFDRCVGMGRRFVDADAQPLAAQAHRTRSNPRRDLGCEGRHLLAGQRRRHLRVGGHERFEPGVGHLPTPRPPGRELPIRRDQAFSCQSIDGDRQRGCGASVVGRRVLVEQAGQDLPVASTGVGQPPRPSRSIAVDGQRGHDLAGVHQVPGDQVDASSGLEGHVPRSTSDRRRSRSPWHRAILAGGRHRGEHPPGTPDRGAQHAAGACTAAQNARGPGLECSARSRSVRRGPERFRGRACGRRGGTRRGRGRAVGGRSRRGRPTRRLRPRDRRRRPAGAAREG